MNSRIKELRKKLGLSQDQFGKKLGLTRGAITNIELNKTTPKPLLVDLICKVFDVNEEWLRTGEGDMFEAKTRDDVISDFMVDLLKEEDDSFRKRLIEALSYLNEEEWKLLANIAEKLAQKKD